MKLNHGLKPPDLDAVGDESDIRAIRMVWLFVFSVDAVPAVMPTNGLWDFRDIARTMERTATWSGQLESRARVELLF